MQIKDDALIKNETQTRRDFLLSLDKWRVELAKNIAFRNRDVNEDEFNFAVQLIIDRIVFLRIAEDRNIERYGELLDTIKNGDYYQNLLQRFHVAEQKYNSGLFDFKKDKHNKIVKFVDQLLQLNKELQSTVLVEKSEQLKHRIDYIESKIDELVYQLYGLSDKDIKSIDAK